MWRIFGLVLSEIHPSVLQLPLHLPDMQRVTFKEGDNLNDIAAQENASILTEYFVANQNNEWARGILYRDFPQWFTWQPEKYWRKRKRDLHQVGRIVTANPAEGERYFLRVLLNHVPGSTSFEYLKASYVDCRSYIVPTAQKGRTHGPVKNKIRNVCAHGYGPISDYSTE